MTVKRYAILLVLGVSTLAGCRACGTCYDYSPPVADCACGTCGHGRAGSNITGPYCGANGCESTYEEGQPQMTTMPMEESESTVVEPTPSK